MNLIIFLSFYYLAFFSGRGVCLLFKNKSEKDVNSKQFIEGVNVDIFYPVISLFFIGNCLVLVNFFTSLKTAFPVIVLVIIFMLLGNLRVKFEIKNLKMWLIQHNLVPIILSITLYGSRFHFDTGAYHLNYQNLLRTEKISLGSANLNFGYGFSSILEYLEAILWYPENLVFVFFINLIFHVLLFSFLFNSIYIGSTYLKVSSIFLVLFGFLDNFGYLGGANGFFKVQAIAKPDIPFAIAFIIISQLIISKIQNSAYLYRDIKLLSIATVFLVQIKLLGLYIGLLILYYLYQFNKNHKLEVKKFFTEIKISISLFLIWIFKNFLISGCFLFPLNFTCVKRVDWFIDGYLNSYIYSVKATQKAYIIGSNFSDWFESFLSKGFNMQILINFFCFIIILLLFRNLFFTTEDSGDIKKVLAIINIIFISTWILSSPVPRWGAHIYPFIVITLGVGLKFKNGYLSKKLLVSSLFTVFILTAALFPRMYSYQSLFDERGGLYKLNLPKVEYILNTSKTGYIVDYNLYQPQQCWVNKDCLLSDKAITFKIIRGYKVYLPDGSISW
jgi:hypothetical protein